MRVTDRQTDRILLAIPRLHYMQRGKNQLSQQLVAFSFQFPFRWRELSSSPQWYINPHQSADEELTQLTIRVYQTIASQPASSLAATGRMPFRYRSPCCIHQCMSDAITGPGPPRVHSWSIPTAALLLLIDKTASRRWTETGSGASSSPCLYKRPLYRRHKTLQAPPTLFFFYAPVQRGTVARHHRNVTCRFTRRELYKQESLGSAVLSKQVRLWQQAKLQESVEW